jgi:hypothetical protein
VEVIIKIDSWQEFDSLAKDHDGWAFRGHCDAEWHLLSSLSRYLKTFVPDKSIWQAREERAMRIFRRKAHHYISDLRILDEDLRCLALMQHHGAPTRLLDFTKSPYVAAFFALENATTDAAVFALNTPFLWRAAPDGSPNLTRKEIDPRKPGNFKKYFLASKYEHIWFGEPRQMDRRLLAQSGNFVVPGLFDKPVNEILNRYSSTEPLLKKIVIPAQRIREECMQSLYRMNITNATLFPDLDGLAKSMAVELEMNWRGFKADPHKC